MDFRKECEEWLKPLGYTIASRTANDTRYTFTSVDEHFAPAITCTLQPGGHKTCKVTGGHTLKMFLTLSSGEMMFKHPDIKKYISVLTHYEKLCHQHPPF